MRGRPKGSGARDLTGEQFEQRINQRPRVAAEIGKAMP